MGFFSSAETADCFGKLVIFLLLCLAAWKMFGETKKEIKKKEFVSGIGFFSAGVGSSLLNAIFLANIFFYDFMEEKREILALSMNLNTGMSLVMVGIFFLASLFARLDK